MKVTITLPEGNPAVTWGYAFSDGKYTTLPANRERRIKAFEEGFVLYLPFSVGISTAVAWTSLLSVLNATWPGTPDPDAINLPAVQIADGQIAPITTPVVNLAASDSIYVPVTNILGEKINMKDGMNALDAVATPAAIVSTTPTPAPTADQLSTGYSSPGTGPIPPTVTATPRSTLPGQNSKETNDESDSSITGGVLAGSIVGAFIAAVITCGLIACFCLRRRGPRHVASETHSSGSSNDYALANLARDHEKSQVIVAASSVTGWQKHLPQEKDDGSITKLFRSIFEQVRLHMEGYYGADPQNPSDTTIETLRKLAEDDLPLMLSQSEKQILLLEGILLRCIIHRTSGRSDVKDSFLPSELIKIAKSNGWYMERTPRNSGIVSAGRKRGFPQALAQWRQLTGFLLPEHRDDQAYQSELRVKIEHAVTEIDAAFLTWACAGKSSDKRMESLKQILLQASDAGILLFTQPSTFIFDWSVRGERDDRAATISPALVRFTEGAAKEDVLIEASQVKL